MSAAKHTPGPWTHEDGQTGMPVITDSEGIFVAGIGTRREEEEEANARLIAAAPDLLQALRGICDEQDERQGYASHEAYDKARAAIAKATGEGA